MMVGSVSCKAAWKSHELEERNRLKPSPTVLTPKQTTYHTGVPVSLVTSNLSNIAVRSSCRNLVALEHWKSRPRET